MRRMRLGRHAMRARSARGTEFTTVMAVLLTLMLAWLVSCVTVAPLVDPDKEIGVFGVTALPPQDGDWVVLSISGRQALLGREGSRQSESLIAAISIYQLPDLDTDGEFLTYVAEGRASGPDIGRFEILQNEEALSTLRGATCVKYHSVSRDRAAHLQGGGTGTMILDNRGYHCRHPRDRDVGVQIEYSLRHFPDRTYPSAQQHATRFFDDVRFTDF